MSSQHRSPMWQANLNRMLSKLEEIKNLPFIDSGTHLHMGCGPNVLKGYTNIDKYYEHPEVLKQDMHAPEFVPGTISSIYSSHSLEHLPFRLAKLALQNWNKLLRPGGRLHLAIPDLEDIMRTMLDPNVSLHIKETWYIYTLFGYQVDPNQYSNNQELNLPVDPGQFHQCGFTKESISFHLQNSGFKITELYHYNGYCTPSMWVEAVKE